MVRNNHSNENRRELGELLQSGEASFGHDFLPELLNYAKFLAEVENALVVISDMAAGNSHIIAGGFAQNLELDGYRMENSIWEKRIFSLMSPQALDEKYIAELRFFHYLRHQPKSKKSEYYLVSKLRFRFVDGDTHDVLHRMYYIFDENKENVRFAICIYGPLPFDFNGKSYVVNSVTGITEELTASGDDSILSPRECQVLSLIYTGMKSAEIAQQLNISVHTVSRHRQEIIGKLQVKNSHEACRIAKTLKIIH